MFGFISKFDSNGKNFYIVRTKGGVSILTEWEYRKVWGKLPQKQVDQRMILLGEIKMQTVKFVTKENEKIIVWCATNTLTGFRNFLQYILDNTNIPEDFYMIDLKSDLVYNAYHIATEVYKMRKRTFEERMEDIQTGKWFGVDVKELEKSFNMKR